MQDKKILLLIDNAPSHFDPNYRPPVETNEQDEDEGEIPEASTSRNRAGASKRELLKFNFLIILPYIAKKAKKDFLNSGVKKQNLPPKI